MLPIASFSTGNSRSVIGSTLTAASCESESSILLPLALDESVLVTAASAFDAIRPAPKMYPSVNDERADDYCASSCSHVDRSANSHVEAHFL
jgi:hypothetical protein